jgi:hypothetical protein
MINNERYYISFMYMIKLVHFGLSEAEREALYNMLREPFGVVEEEVKEVEKSNYNNNNNNILSSIYIEFPIRYDEGFIKILGLDRWEGLKEMVKNMKWRRGKSMFILTLHFNDGDKSTIFTIKSSNNRIFNKAIDGIEYVVDTVYFRDVKDAKHVSFEFSIDDMRWYPVQVSRGIGNG